MNDLGFWTEQGLLFCISFVANGLSALAGGGAGLLQLPALLLLGLPFTTALATHKIATVALGVGATFRHAQNQTMTARFALFVLLAGLPGVALGAYLIVDVPHEWATHALGLLTIGLGIYSIRAPDLGQHSQSKHRSLSGFVWGGIGLCLIGVLNGALASGTGLFVTIWLVYWFGLDYKQAVAYTLVLVGVIWNGSGAAILALQVEVKWSWLLPLLIGSFIGGYIGTHVGIVRGNRLIKRAFESLTILVGLSLLLS